MVESSCEASQLIVLEGQVLRKLPGPPASHSSSPQASSLARGRAGRRAISYGRQARGCGSVGAAVSANQRRVGRGSRGPKEPCARAASMVRSTRSTGCSRATPVTRRARIALGHSGRQERQGRPHSNRRAGRLLPARQLPGLARLVVRATGRVRSRAALVSAQRAESLEADSALAARARCRAAAFARGHRTRRGGGPRGGRERTRSESARAHHPGIRAPGGRLTRRRHEPDFSAAIERDSFNALPQIGAGARDDSRRRPCSGAGAARDRRCAGSLNSMLRSYVGKAYYEERTSTRSELARTQFDFAKALDPNDPTPWLYDAFRLQSINRPVEAADAFDESIELNENRAVFRSQLRLDSDHAARSAGLGGALSRFGIRAPCSHRRLSVA